MINCPSCVVPMGRHGASPTDSVELVGDALDFLVELFN